MRFNFVLSIFIAAIVVECGRRVTDSDRLQTLAAAQQRREYLDSTRDERRARARERAGRSAQPDAQHAELQAAQPQSLDEPGNATQQAEEAALAAHHDATDPEIAALNNRMELRQHEAIMQMHHCICIGTMVLSQGHLLFCSHVAEIIGTLQGLLKLIGYPCISGKGVLMRTEDFKTLCTWGGHVVRYNIISCVLLRM